MSHGQRCAVCLGSGTVLKPDYFGQAVVVSFTTWSCDSCSGKGWIGVPDKSDPKEE